MFQAARDVDGFNSGWVQQSVWRVPPPVAALLDVVSMTPARNSGSGYPIRFTFRNLAGADQIVSTSVLVNGYLDGYRGCYLGYHVENIQCRIKALQSGAEINGTDLTLTLMIEFKVGFTGDRVFYVSAQDGITTSGWQVMASWTVP